MEEKAAAQSVSGGAADQPSQSVASSSCSAPRLRRPSLPPSLISTPGEEEEEETVSSLALEGEEHLSRGDAFSALDAGMAAIKLAAARAVEEEGAGDEENEREKRAVAVAAGVENGERGGLASSSSPLAPPPPSHPFPIPLSRLWRLVARAQSSLNKPWASAAAWRQAAMLAEDEVGARGDEAWATEQDAAAAADAAARYG